MAIISRGDCEKSKNGRNIIARAATRREHEAGPSTHGSFSKEMADQDDDLRVWLHHRYHLSSCCAGRALSPRARGYAIGVATILLISPDAMWLRLCQEEDAIVVAHMRLAWVTAFVTISVALQLGGVRRALVLRCGWRQYVSGRRRRRRTRGGRGSRGAARVALCACD